jgi:hypothetical protein
VPLENVYQQPGHESLFLDKLLFSLAFLSRQTLFFRIGILFSTSSQISDQTVS